MRWAGTVVLVLFALLAVLVAPAGALAAPAWLPPVTVSSPGEENAPGDIAMGPDGTAIAVWQRAECQYNSENHECKEGAIQYSVRPPGGSFSAPAYMPGDQATVFATQPRVATDAAGNALAVWAAGPGPLARVHYSVRPAGGDFQDVRLLIDNLEGRHNFPSLAMAPDGRAIVTFDRFVGGNSVAGYAIRPPGGNFGPAQSMAGDPGTGLNRSPEVHVDATGEAIANWSSPSPATEIRYARLSAGGAEFEPTQTLEKGSATLAMAPSGAAVMIWNLYGSGEDLRYAFRPPGGDFGVPMTFPEPDGPLGPQVAIDPEGRAVAVWTSLTPNENVRWAAAPAGGPFGPATPLTGADNGVLNALDISAQGTALALWVDGSDPVLEVHASLRPAGGVFGESAVLSGPPQGAHLSGGSVGFDPQGNAAALWSGRDPTLATSHDVPLLAAILEAGPGTLSAPSLTGLRVQPRRFAVGRAPTAKVSRKPGTKIRFQLSEQATVRLTVQRGRPGLRAKVKGKTRCLRLTQGNRRRAKGKRRCTRFRKVGALVRRDRKAGANKVAFSGRIGRKALRPGRYRIVAVATDQSNERSLPRRAGFRVLR